MNVHLDEKVKDYLLRKGTDSLYITLQPMKSWGSIHYQPVVGLGIPDNIAEFDKKKVNQMDVYLSKSIEADGDQIFIRYSKFLFMESLDVSGIDL